MQFSFAHQGLQWSDAWFLAQGLFNTIRLAATAALIGTLVGIVLGWLRAVSIVVRLLTAPIIEQFAGVICAGGSVRSHLGILSREYGIPCLMNARVSGATRAGERPARPPGALLDTLAVVWGAAIYGRPSPSGAPREGM